MTRQEFEKALKDGVKEFVIKHRCSLGCEDTIVKLRDDDGSISPLFANKGGARRWVFLSCLEPIYPELEFKVGDRVKSRLIDGLGKIIKVDQLKGEYLVLHDEPYKNMHNGDANCGYTFKERTDRCWWYTFKELEIIQPKQEDISEFKVGDRIDTPWYDDHGCGSGTVIQIMGRHYTVLHDISRECLHSAKNIYEGKIPESVRKNRCWIYLKEDIKHSSVPAPKPSKKLLFDVCYDKICVKLVVDGECQAYAEAKVACPEDAFHLLTGAQIALQRLAEKTGSKIIVPKSALSDRVELI